MATLRLGVTDRGAKPQNPAVFFGPYHESSHMPNKFRGEKNGRWRGFKEQPGQAVFNLQTRLRLTIYALPTPQRCSKYCQV